MTAYLRLATFLLFTAASIAASAAPVHSLGDQAPTGFNTNGIFSGAARGWEFTAGVANINVSQLGIAPASGGSYTLSLWDVATQSVLAQTTMATTVGGAWNWANLASSVELTAGQNYLVLGTGNDSGQSYYFGNGLASSWYPDGTIDYVTTRYCNGCGANTFPLNKLDGYHYGLVDIGYTVGTDASTVPEPSTFAILAIGLLALGASFRKKSH